MMFLMATGFLIFFFFLRRIGFLFLFSDSLFLSRPNKGGRRGGGRGEGQELMENLCMCINQKNPASSLKLQSKSLDPFPGHQDAWKSGVCFIWKLQHPGPRLFSCNILGVLAFKLRPRKRAWGTNIYLACYNGHWVLFVVSPLPITSRRLGQIPGFFAIPPSPLVPTPSPSPPSPQLSVLLDPRGTGIFPRWAHSR